MDSSLARMMQIALGHSAQTDAFQGGREAAQSAKSQLSEGKFDLAITLGPQSSDLQDYLEGVRLVAGDQGLLGLPSQSVITSDIYLPDGKLVCLLRPENMHVSLAASHSHECANVEILTTLLSQHRRQRGTASHQFEQRGLIFIDNRPCGSDSAFLQQAIVECGLESWILFIRPLNALPVPLFCKDMVLTRGLIGVEVLSQGPVGLGSVSLGSFEQTPTLIKEAAKAAVREAKSHPHGPFGFAFFLFDFDITPQVATDLQAELNRPDSPIKDIPWVAFRSAAHGVKYAHLSGQIQKQSITVALFPS